jgi:hypothetical protein
MAHLLQALAQHLHLNASQYWQLRLICSIMLGPLLAVLYLVFFTKHEVVKSSVTRVKRRVQTLASRPATHSPLRPTTNQS